jgi:hypothetical protein
MNWLTTYDGIDFIPAGPDAYVFVVELHGTYTVAWCGAKRGKDARYTCCDEKVPQRWCTCGQKRERSQTIVASGEDRETAYMRALSLAVAMGGEPFEGGGWRELPPTRAQVAMARGIGLVVPGRTTEAGTSVPAVTGGELGTMITVKLASERIDGLAATLRQRVMA